MKASNLTLLAGATLAMSMSLASLPAAAQQPPGSSAGAPAATTPGPRQARPARPEIFTPEEQERFRQRMNEAKTPEERDTVRRERRAAEEARAKEKGITLPRRPEPRSGERAENRGDKDAGGERRQSPMAQLLTQEDRDQYRKSMHNAKTPEERAKVRSEMRATVEQRAKDKGIKLPEHPPGPRHGPRGPAAKDGSAPAAPATPQSQTR